MTYNQIDPLISMGLGFAAKEIGVPYNAYRPTGTGDVIQSGNLIASNVKAFVKMAYGQGVKESLESGKNEYQLSYKLVMDTRPFKVGDVFILSDTIYGQGYSSVNFATNEFNGFAIADLSPIKKRFAGRLNLTVNILRPNSVPNASAQWDKTIRNAQPVICTAGVFGLGAVGAPPCNIPAGLVATVKSYGLNQFDSVPAQQRKSSWLVYVPALNGFSVREGDRILANGARYIVVVPYTQTVGLTGGQWFLEREA